MKLIRLFLIAFLCIYGIALQAQSDVESIINNRGEALVYIDILDYNEIALIASITNLNNVNKSGVTVYINKESYLELKKHGYYPELYMPYYSGMRSIEMADSVSEMSNWDKYPTWAVYQEMMSDFYDNFPNICVLDTIGYSKQGRAITTIKISDNPGIDEIEPEVFLTGQMHGDELVSYIVMLRLIEYLVNSYGSNSRVTSLVNSTEIWINPLANPDGTYRNNENDVSFATRFNADGVDLNRNFPDPQDGQHPDGNPTAPENLAMIDFAEQRNFILSANIHSGAEVVNYPWDTWPTLHADDSWWQDISREFADTVHFYSPAGYLDDLNNGITNGYQWYTTSGSRQDYTNYFPYCRELTIELSNEKFLASAELPDHWDYCRSAFLTYIEQSNEGIEGYVTDSIIGEPLKAEIRLINHDNNNSQVYSDSATGHYHRLIDGGLCSIQYLANGYKPKTKTISFNNNDFVLLNAQLVPYTVLPPDVGFTSSDTLLECSYIVNFLNTTISHDTASYVWDFGDGSTSTELNPVHHYYQNGEYSVSLTATNTNGTSNIENDNYIKLNLSELDSVHNSVECSSPAILTLNAYAQGEIQWFDALPPDSIIHTGSSFTSPQITESRVYYARSAIPGDSGSLGEPDNTEGGAYNTDTGTEHYLEFNCTESVIINSVTVYAQDSSERTIYLKDSSGNIIDQKSMAIDSGEQEIQLDFSVNPGESYRLSANQNCGLFRGFIGLFSLFDYPYDWNGVLTITESDNSSFFYTSRHFYSYFYNWQITEQECYSELEPVYAGINEVPLTSFDYSTNGLTVEFFNQSEFAEDYLWDFDDGNYSSDANPVHTFTSDGDYKVTLSSSNPCHSSDTSVIITVSGSGIDNIENHLFEIYPNPAESFIIIVINKNVTGKVELFSIDGVRILNQEVFEKEEISLNGLSSGIYILKLDIENKHFFEKIIIE